MTSPESGSHGGSGKANFLKNFFEALFKPTEKEIRKRAEKGVERRKERAKHETPKEREQEDKRREEKDKLRPYQQSESGEKKAIDVIRARLERAGEVKSQLDQALQSFSSSDPRDVVKRPVGVDYFLVPLRKDPQLLPALKQLIVSSPVAAEVVYKFVSPGTGVHGNVRELIRETQRLFFEAKADNKVPALTRLFEAVSERASVLLWNEFQANKHRDAAEILTADKGILLSEAEEGALSGTENDPRQTKERWENAVRSMLTTTREEVPPSEIPEYVEKGKTPVSGPVFQKMSSEVDNIWGEVERRERQKGGQLDIRDLEDFDRQIREAESRARPQDVIANSPQYDKAVQQNKAYVEKKLNILAERLKLRLRQEVLPVQKGITDPKVFLEQMALHKGRLFVLLLENPEMERLFRSISEEGRHFRQKVFLKIHSSVMYDQRNSSQDNFGLYERADFTTFIDSLRAKLSTVKVEKTGASLGQAWADSFNNLSNAIRQSRDIDFWASQPAASIENYNKSLGMFQNEYTYQAMSMPAVGAAFRAYETALRSIMTSNDGYIPPGLIEYSATNYSGIWDNQARETFSTMIKAGTVKDLKRDEHTGLNVIMPDGHTLEAGEALDLSSLDSDEIYMYMTLAKGVGMASLRFLEYFANSRIPGSEQPEQGIGYDLFGSNAYEGVARAMNYMNMFIHKWKIGSYRYFYLMNMLLPEHKKIKNLRAEDSREAVKMYMAYMDDPLEFEKTHGGDARRFLDMTNFSGISSAIGKDTKWRQWGATVEWPDRQREFLGGPTQLVLSERYAEYAVRELLVEGKYKEDYRQSIIDQNKKNPDHLLPVSGSGFEKLWKENGLAKYENKIKLEWERLLGRSPEKGQQDRPHETEAIMKAYKKALDARIWVEMAMRNPLVVAHNLKVPVSLVGVEGKKKVKLHSLIVQRVLGIPPGDLKYAEEFGKAGWGRTPSEKQKSNMNAVMQLEADLAAVREIAIENGEDLKDDDFDVIKDETRKGQALKYWKMVRKVILGSDSTNAVDLYKKFGLGLMDNGEDYEWNHEEILKIDDTLKGIAGEKFGDKKAFTITAEDGKPIDIPVLLNQAVDTEFEWIIGTDDINFRKMDWLNLGSRHWLRRGGDIEAHWKGGQAVADYLINSLTPSPEKGKLVEALLAIRKGYEGDMIEIGWTVAGNLAYLTSRLYSWDWGRLLSKLGSPMQIDITKTRRNTAGWFANERREFWDAVEHMNVVPPGAHFYHYNWINKKNIHDLREAAHATTTDVWKEIIVLGVILATLITLYRGLTAKSEEEESGGGGGGGGRN